MSQEFFEDIEEIKSYQKKQTLLAYVRTIASLLALVVIVAALVLFAPQILNTVDHIDSTLARVDSMVSEADDTISSIKETIGSASGTSTEGLEGLADAIEKINSIDFDTLNESINSLQEVVSGLSRLTSFFGQ